LRPVGVLAAGACIGLLVSCRGVAHGAGQGGASGGCRRAPAPARRCAQKSQGNGGQARPARFWLTREHGQPVDGTLRAARGQQQALPPPPTGRDGAAPSALLALAGVRGASRSRRWFAALRGEGGRRDPTLWALGARAVALRVPALWTLGGVRVLVQAARVLSQLRRKAHDGDGAGSRGARAAHWRSEEHMSELQSRENLVCRLLLE